MKWPRPLLPSLPAMPLFLMEEDLIIHTRERLQRLDYQLFFVYFFFHHPLPPASRQHFVLFCSAVAAAARSLFFTIFFASLPFCPLLFQSHDLSEYQSPLNPHSLISFSLFSSSYHPRLELQRSEVSGGPRESFI
ncbi:hypothetical protein AVEN_81378-1 [Araneus ventricosus]|uniref:Uncharacterized protein n=1 Tax=Araneus ventricosus TaxID=182803 RepID=A0A4Y2B5X0_ARAVE|nr:hypothetical protein AVEN_81378-1 [Araneus ventricosus]